MMSDKYMNPNDSRSDLAFARGCPAGCVSARMKESTMPEVANNAPQRCCIVGGGLAAIPAWVPHCPAYIPVRLFDYGLRQEHVSTPTA